MFEIYSPPRPATRHIESLHISYFSPSVQMALRDTLVVSGTFLLSWTFYFKQRENCVDSRICLEDIFIIKVHIGLEFRERRGKSLAHSRFSSSSASIRLGRKPKLRSEWSLRSGEKHILISDSTWLVECADASREEGINRQRKSFVHILWQSDLLCDLFLWTNNLIKLLQKCVKIRIIWVKSEETPYTENWDFLEKR